METVYAFSSFVGGIALLVVGSIHFFKSVLGHRWCNDSCYGPYLYWDKDDFFRDSNVKFRHTFSLMPKPFGENFGVIFLALLTLRTHMSRSGEVMTSFRQNASWLVLVGLFAAFPFAGGFGIVIGFMLMATAALGFICHLCDLQGNATLGLVMDTPRSMDRIGGSCRFPEWFFRLWNVLILAVLSLTILNNFIHIFRNEFHHWCKSNDHDDCVGPFLIWPSDFLNSVNADKWGSVFSLDINRGLELWAPAFLVMTFLAVSNESWLLNAVFLVVLALFGAFGYSGNMGIIVGTMLCVAACIALLVGLLGGREAQAPPVSNYRYAMSRESAASLL